MDYLIGLVIIVMLAGAIATIAIGQSKENQTENTGYGSGTTRKWGRLLVIYVLCIIVILVIFLAFLR
ncbi:hypothetical protein COLU111180_18920 [Cohnella lubricantis]|uniref:Uncharacterized protein n=1 Tax=Cohnella lubricantis TaxID=2163172 RepID=A0A841TDE4_9BACL|nr:hypothetical protein [Cohnella lubricantis]MBB6678045.1 hypothetical protein [Cohnella lubricantis]MBP2120021.1 ABC-type Mn2+/Zn2+ transport system permease subunit [Cohnella lubricantis]